MSIWTKSIIPEQTDDKIKAVGSVARRAFFLIISIGLLALWTYVVRGIHDYCHTLSAWSDGASKRGPDHWTPYIILWIVPVLLVILVGLMARASTNKQKE